MTAHCGVCGRPTADNTTVCAPCGRERLVRPLRRLLTAGTDSKGHAIPGLLDDLEDQLRRDTVYADQVKARAAETPVPFDVRASEAGWVLRNTLVGWVRVLQDTSGATADLWPADDTPSLARWLLERVPRLRLHEAGPEAADEISDVVRLVEDAVDSPANRTVVTVGPCPERDEQDGPCMGEVRAIIPATWAQVAYMVCSLCGARWETHQWNRAGRRIRRTERLRTRPFVDSKTAALAFGVTDRTVRQWVVEGWLINHGTTRRILIDPDELGEDVPTRRAQRRAYERAVQRGWVLALDAASATM